MLIAIVCDRCGTEDRAQLEIGLSWDPVVREVPFAADDVVRARLPEGWANTPVWDDTGHLCPLCSEAALAEPVVTDVDDRTGVTPGDGGEE